MVCVFFCGLNSFFITKTPFIFCWLLYVLSRFFYRNVYLFRCGCEWFRAVTRVSSQMYLPDNHCESFLFPLAFSSSLKTSSLYVTPWQTVTSVCFNCSMNKMVAILSRGFISIPPCTIKTIAPQHSTKRNTAEHFAAPWSSNKIKDDVKWLYIKPRRRNFSTNDISFLMIPLYRLSLKNYMCVWHK